MVGLPGSGKTTRAIELAEEYNALRLTPDEWQYFLFGSDFDPDGDNTEHDIRHTKIEQLMWDTAKKVLPLGIDVILDFGCWAKEERDEFRRKAESLGADFKIHYMDCPLDILWERVKERSKKPGEFSISRENLEQWSKIFEPPTAEELNS